LRLRLAYRKKKKMKIEYKRKKNRVIFDVSNWGKSTNREMQEISILQWIFRKFDTIGEDVMIGTIQLFEKNNKICAGIFEIKTYQ
jgi:hypothetical protein